MPRLWREFDHDLAYVAAEKCFRDKWRRGDVRTFIEEWTGHSRKELTANEYINGKLQFGLKYEILQEVALVIEDMGSRKGGTRSWTPFPCGREETGERVKSGTLQRFVTGISCLDMR